MATRRSVSKERAITAASDRIGDALSEWRRAQRLTQAELAQRAHTSISTIAKIESGDPTVSMSTMGRAIGWPPMLFDPVSLTAPSSTTQTSQEVPPMSKQSRLGLEESTVLSVVHTLGLLDRVVEGFDPLRSDFGAALITDELPKRVRRRG